MNQLQVQNRKALDHELSGRKAIEATTATAKCFTSLTIGGG